MLSSRSCVTLFFASTTPGSFITKHQHSIPLTLPRESYLQKRDTKPTPLLPFNRQRSTIRNCTPSVSTHDKPTLYDVLNIPRVPDPRTLTVSEIRAAYIRLAKVQHPDVSAATTDIIDAVASNDDESGDKIGELSSFDQISRAWAILSDDELRRVYDASGEEGLKAIESILQRRSEVEQNLVNMSGDQLDMLSETGQLFNTSLLSPSQSPLFDHLDVDEQGQDDACPRSVEQAIEHIESHPDESVKYYTLWWIYRFKVVQAESCLIALLNNPRSALRLRRRAALALGVVATTMSAVDSLLNAFKRTSDYFLCYRCAEALAAIGYRVQRDETIDIHFPSDSIHALLHVLDAGGQAIDRRSEDQTGFKSQESLFDLDAIEDEETRARLRKIFQQRERSEEESKRTTMTPQLGVQKVGTSNSEDDRPYEWIIKAVCAIVQTGHVEIASGDIVENISPFTRHEHPLVKYAAHKTLFCVTGNDMHAKAIVNALDYGVEHHYSQRVLCRDLGDMGYWQGAAAITDCPMVENSFKILALKNMLSKLNYDASTPQVQQVLLHMDSLL